MYQDRIIRNPAGIALQHLNQGELPHAEHEARRALALQPKSHEALSMLAFILYRQGRTKEAQPLIDRALALAPKNHHYHNIAAQIAVATGDLRKAALSYERAHRLDPDDPSGISGRADILFREKKFEKALALLDPFIKRGKDDIGIAVSYGRICRELKLYDRGIDAVSRHLNSPADEPDSLASIFFTLGQLYEARGDYPQAMDAYIRANNAIPSRYDPAEVAQHFHNLRRIFTRDMVRAAPKPDNPSSVPVFIIGMPRSGTTLTEQIIHAHPDAFGAGELCHLLPETFRNLALKIGSTLPVPDCARDLDRSDINELASNYLAAIHALAGADKRRITDKCLGNDATVGLIAILFPGAHIIHVKRDPIDNCLACFSRMFPQNHPGFTKSLETLGSHYLAHHALMDHWKQELDIPILTIHYEELVAEQERISRQMIDFIGLPWNDACLAFYKEHRQVRTMSMHQVDKPIYTTSIGRAERFGPALDPLRRALAGS